VAFELIRQDNEFSTTDQVNEWVGLLTGQLTTNFRFVASCLASVQRFEMVRVRALNSCWKAHMNPLAESFTPQLELHKMQQPGVLLTAVQMRSNI
jgi:hypothetical protein